jgi:hypothetical protein
VHIQTTVVALTDRVEGLTLIAEHFQDERILERLTNLLLNGGTIQIEASDGHYSKIVFPGKATQVDGI